MKTEKELDDLMLRCSQQIGGAQIYDEFRRLLSLLNRTRIDERPINSIIEIGSEGGGSLLVWLNMFDPLAVFTVDLNSYGHASGKTAEFEAQWKSWAKPMQTVDCTWGNSHDEATKGALIDKIKARGLEQVDMLYIDGDHTEKGFESDYNMYKELVKPGGLMVFHDIHPYPGREIDTPERPGVGAYKFWNRLKGEAIDMFVDRSYHPGLRPNFLEICHDCQKQSAFGYGILFV